MPYKTNISGAISRRSQGRGEGKNYKNWQHVELLPHSSRVKIHYRRKKERNKWAKKFTWTSAVQWCNGEGAEKEITAQGILVCYKGVLYIPQPQLTKQ